LRRSTGVLGRPLEDSISALTFVRELVPTSLDNGHRSPKKLLRSVVTRLLGRESVDHAVLAEGSTYTIQDSGAPFQSLPFCVTA